MWAPVYSKAVASSINLNEPVSSTVIVLCIAIHVGIVARLLLHDTICTSPIELAAPGSVSSYHSSVGIKIVVFAIIFNPSGFHFAVSIQVIPATFEVNPTSLLFTICVEVIVRSLDIDPIRGSWAIIEIVIVFAVFFYPTSFYLVVWANVKSKPRKLYGTCRLSAVISRKDTIRRKTSSQHSIWTSPAFNAIGKGYPWITDKTITLIKVIVFAVNGMLANVSGIT